MLQADFNALPVLVPSAALLPVSAGGLAIGDFFLLPVDSDQIPVSLVPDANRIVYCQRISQDRTGGPYPLPTSILQNLTHVAQPVSAGGPFPPSGAEITPVDDPLLPGNYINGTYYNSDPVVKFAGEGYASLTYPDDPFPGQGAAGYVRVFDLLE